MIENKLAAEMDFIRCDNFALKKKQNSLRLSGNIARMVLHHNSSAALLLLLR